MPPIEDIISYIQFLAAEQPWWIYGLLALIPICMLVTVREFFCWFWKINKLVDRLERIEIQLRNLRLGNEIPPAVREQASSFSAGASSSRHEAVTREPAAATALNKPDARPLPAASSAEQLIQSTTIDRPGIDRPGIDRPGERTKRGPTEL